MVRVADSRIQLAFVGGMGLAGWLVVLLLSFYPEVAGFEPWSWSDELGACFFFAGAARFLAFRAYSRVRIAIDSGFYIATVFICGLLPASTLLLLILTADFIIRFVIGSGLFRLGEVSWLRVLAQSFYSGGLPALLLLTLGSMVGDSWFYIATDLMVCWALPLFTIVFLTSHYVLTGGSHLLLGIRLQTVSGFVLRVIGAEMLLLPLALAMVLGYRHQGFWFFSLVGMASLLTNGVYRRQARVGEELRQRVDELSTLNEVGRVISGSLQKDTLVRNIATATLHLVGHTSRFMIGLINEDTGRLNCRFFDESGTEFLQMEIAPTAGLSGWMMANRSPLLLPELQRQYGDYVNDETYNDPKYHSWLGVPLLVYDEVVGVMSIQSEEYGVFTQGHLRVLSTIADQAAVALENSRLYGLATIDGLTGLFVRRYFDYRLEEEWERSLRYENPFVIGIFDLDNFKSVNDTHGHPVGDRVLRAAGKVIRKNMRSIDIAARYGGEEFAFILPRTSLSEAAAVAERIRTDIAGIDISIDSGILKATVSIGLAGFPDSKTANVQELLAFADQALYRAKRGGKNRVQVHGESVDIVQCN